jgi:hypothetical protein
MMLVHDAPSSAVFAKSHCQAKLEAGFVTVSINGDASADRRCKGYILPGGYLHVIEVEYHGVAVRMKNVSQVAM